VNTNIDWNESVREKGEACRHKDIDIWCPSCYPHDSGKLCLECGYFYCSHCGTLTSLQEFVEMVARIRADYAKYFAEEDKTIEKIITTLHQREK
jgi:hypothetical protein